MTGGADSTVNVFDIGNMSEDDALLTSTVIDSTINHITWYVKKKIYPVFGQRENVWFYNIWFSDMCPKTGQKSGFQTLA